MSVPDLRLVPPAAAPRIRCDVRISDMTIDANIGVYPHERHRTQPLVIDVEAEVAMPRDDRLHETLDYDVIAGFVRMLAQSHLSLVETFAYRLAERCLVEPGVRRVVVSVRKPEALRNAFAGARVTLTGPLAHDDDGGEPSL